MSPAFSSADRAQFMQSYSPRKHSVEDAPGGLVDWPSSTYTHATRRSTLVVVGKHGSRTGASTAYLSAKPRKASPEAHPSNPILLTSSLSLDVHPPDRFNQPPSLNKRRLVPLPALSNAPILIHPFLAYSPSYPPFQYEILSSLSSITLSPDATQEVWRGWKRHAATDPPNIGSLTIRMAAISRLIIVFPATMSDSVVTVEDVLMAVHRSALVAVHDDPLWTNGRELRLQCQRHTTSTGYGHDNNGDCLHSSLWWAGLYPSPDERDVWILHTKDSSGNLL